MTTSPERPEHRACRERTDYEDMAVVLSEARRSYETTMRYREDGSEWHEVKVHVYESPGWPVDSCVGYC